MTPSRTIEALYEEWVECPSLEYRQQVSAPVDLPPIVFEQFLKRLHHQRIEYPNMAFWLVFDYRTLDVTRRDGDAETLGLPVRSKYDFLTRIHPDYVLPYLRWRRAAYQLAFQYPQKVRRPLAQAFRISIPLRTSTQEYWWFFINSVVVQVDAAGRIATNLQTFYRDTKWSSQSLRPVEASLFSHLESMESLNAEMFGQMTLQMTEVFTDAELELLTLYAAGKSTQEVVATKQWSLHTVHEYNAHLLWKARELFAYDFRNARSFARYCRERHLVFIPPNSSPT